MAFGIPGKVFSALPRRGGWVGPEIDSRLTALIESRRGSTISELRAQIFNRRKYFVQLISLFHFLLLCSLIISCKNIRLWNVTRALRLTTVALSAPNASEVRSEEVKRNAHGAAESAAVSLTHILCMEKGIVNYVDFSFELWRRSARAI